ncbi:MAG: 1-acyl-sn-glycerol-3-phosphate acyltransferase [Chitinophagaceae bacterium]
MLYQFLKIIARLAIRIFCRKIIINKPELLKIKGPVLLASNHPNSFLDSIILDTLFQQPVWSLARGDAFKNKSISRILTALKILPVYRTSEGVENLSENYKTFNACISIFKQDGIVTIFSEGKCINEWHLRPLKKGTARLAIKAWEENIPVTVVPVGINYSSFRRFGKTILLNFGALIQKKDIPLSTSDGLAHQAFNNRLQNELNELVFEIAKDDTTRRKKIFERKPSLVTKIALAIPAIAGWLLHTPLYWPLKKMVEKKTFDNDHYDSVMTGILIFLYPVYVILIILSTFLFINSWWVISLLLIIPFTAWSYVQLKSQTDT